MRIVAVTACPTGIAHTYMAAERLEKAAKKAGHTIRVETQGAMGIENELSPAEVKTADVVIFAAGIPVRNRERFEGLRIVEVSVQEAIKSPDKVISGLEGASSLEGASRLGA
jgi:fructose-specific phosphotransferase system IIB component